MDTKLINVEVKNDQQLVSARDLHKALEVKTRFSLWADQNFKMFEENVDYTSVVVTTEVQNNGGVQQRDLQDYAVTLDMAKELCMMSKTAKGKEIRKYFIQVEKNWNSPEMIIQRALEISNARIQELQAQNKNLTLQLEESNKKASYYDLVLKNESLVTITQIAKDYGMSGREMNYKLHDLKVQYKQGSTWLLYSKYQKTGWTHSDTIVVDRADGTKKAVMQTKWTQKGRLGLHELLKNNGVLPLIERDDIA